MRALYVLTPVLSAAAWGCEGHELPVPGKDRPAAYVRQAENANKLGGKSPSDYRLKPDTATHSWHNVIDLPPGFADGIDNDTLISLHRNPGAVAYLGRARRNQAWLLLRYATLAEYLREQCG
jgi:hypothetical protein